MKGLRLHISALLAILLVAVSCVHEWPEPPGVDPTLINVTIRVLPSGEMTLYPNGNEMVDTKPLYPAPERTARYILELYQGVKENFSVDEATLVWREVLTVDPSQINEVIERKFELHSFHYKFVAWQDLTDPSAPENDGYYSVPSLSAITVPKSSKFYASDENKLAQAVTYDFDLTPYFRKWNIEQSFDIPLYKPLSKYVIVATDVEKFMKSYKANYGDRDGTTAEEILSNCTFKVSYTSYMLTGYNAFKDKLNDSEGGYGFYPELVYMGGSDAVVGFDYVLTCTDTRETLRIDVYDPQGVLINSITNIDVPLSRGKVTVIKGEFLTRDYGGGIGVDPEFEGEFNIPV